jgi:hypothetical protein
LRRCGTRAAPEQLTAEAHRADQWLEHIHRQFLRYKANAGAGFAKMDAPVLAIDQHRTVGRIDRSADDVDQRRLARAVRAEQRENFAALYFEVD